MDEPYKKPSPIWLLSDDLSVIDASLLLIGIEPQGTSEHIEKWDQEMQPEGYLAARNAITSAVRKRSVEGYITHPSSVTQHGTEFDEDRIDYELSRVQVESLQEWLSLRGFRDGYFIQIQKNTGFYDKKHRRYSPKLHAAVEAWEQFDETTDERGTPKQLLAKWLRNNASRFNLTNDDGLPPESVIEELSKICNWSTGGGAPKQVATEPEPDF